MGYAERSNPNSDWNKKRVGAQDFSISSQTTNKQNITKVSIPARRDEPVVIEINPKSLWMLFKEFLCRSLKSTRSPQSLEPTS